MVLFNITYSHWMAGDDKSIMLWDLAAGKRLNVLKGYHQKPVTSLAWSREGTLLASGSLDNTVRLWDASKARVPLS